MKPKWIKTDDGSYLRYGRRSLGRVIRTEAGWYFGEVDVPAPQFFAFLPRRKAIEVAQRDVIRYWKKIHAVASVVLEEFGEKE